MVFCGGLGVAQGMRLGGLSRSLLPLVMLVLFLCGGMRQLRSIATLLGGHVTFPLICASCCLVFQNN